MSPTNPTWIFCSPYLKSLCTPSILFLVSLFPIPSYIFPPTLLLPILFLSPPLCPVSQILSSPLWIPFLRAPPSPPSYPSRHPPPPTNHLSPLPSSVLPLFPAARAPLPPSSLRTPRRRAPAPAPGTEASSAREAARRRSPTRRAGSCLTWTSVSFTVCGEATTAMDRAHKVDSDHSKKNKRILRRPVEQEGTSFQRSDQGDVTTMSSWRKDSGMQRSH